jgi:hypothetical protein
MATHLLLDRRDLFLQSRPAHSAKERLLHQLGQEYHATCEAYDQTVCRHRTRRGTAMPGNSDERRAITANAHRVRRQLLDRIAREGHDISWQELDRAIQDAAPMEDPYAR